MDTITPITGMVTTNCHAHSLFRKQHISSAKSTGVHFRRVYAQENKSIFCQHVAAHQETKNDTCNTQNREVCWQLQANFDATRAHLVLKNPGFQALNRQYEERSKAYEPASLRQMASGSVCQNLSIMSFTFLTFV